MEISVRDIMYLNFETAERDQKGMETEDSALRILSSTCKSLKMDIMQRVLPPEDSRVGECDAVIFSDAGIFVVEVKRIGGVIEQLNSEDEIIKVQQGKENVKRPNPVLIVKKKTESMKSLVANRGEWRKLNDLFQVAKINSTIPVFSLLCFGPSTKVEDNKLQDKTILVATTRTLRASLNAFVESKPKVIGAYRHSKMNAHRWQIQGVLRINRKKGFVRGMPRRAHGSIVDFIDIAAIEGRKNGSFSFTYREKITKTSKHIDSVIFDIYDNKVLKSFEVKKGTQFNWKAGA